MITPEFSVEQHIIVFQNDTSLWQKQTINWKPEVNSGTVYVSAKWMMSYSLFLLKQVVWQLFMADGLHTAQSQWMYSCEDHNDCQLVIMIFKNKHLKREYNINTYCMVYYMVSEWLYDFCVKLLSFLARIGRKRSVHKCEHLESKSLVVCWEFRCYRIHVYQFCWVKVVCVGAATQRWG